ncbi:MAG: 3-deoxy-D-manno-octulosonic acid transferase, partial [Bacteroidetes bacterium]|nr:3-deoxy-D-manno-octulosonic acid transferase [Bacteroidota bacterium]
MYCFYQLIVRIYFLSIRLVAPFNPKAAAWVKGRKGLLKKIEEALKPSSAPATAKKLWWFHCASLGEFEQGRPVIEAIRALHPDIFICLTFFSPSGYEVRKNYQGADLVCYLPEDTPSNAKRLLDLLNPSAVFFVKYEFW